MLRTLASSLSTSALAGLFAFGLVGSNGALAAETAPAKYRDLNHNHRMDPYEDPSLAIDRRLDDLLARMTSEEKIGTLLHASLPSAGNEMGNGNRYDQEKVRQIIGRDHVTSAITRLVAPPQVMAEENNAVQRAAMETRLGIPVTISTDPRNHFQAVLGASTAGGGFSLWPETLGFAALRDPARVRRFGEIARMEYRAVGIQMALSPQADLATEPRWARTTATFGSDPKLVSALVQGYIEGFQNGSNGPRADGVATVVKHWVGYGAEPEGFDGHNAYGSIARLDDASFALHVAAFDGAFAAKTAGVMPTYPIIAGVSIDGKQLEQVGAGFNAQLLKGLLRETKQFEGLVLSDWAITNDCPAQCLNPTAETPQGHAVGMPWGVEKLTQEERFAKGLNAGIDQFGGVNDPAPLVAALKAGTIDMARIDEAARRVLRLKFELGLFDNPFVDPESAQRIVENPRHHAEAEQAQRDAQVMLENGKGMVPIRPGGSRVWLYRVDPAVAKARGFTVVDDPADADIAILRVDTPSEKLHPHHLFGSRQNEGRLDFRDGDADYEAIKRATAVVPTAVAINLDRPAILANVRDKAAALVATFGASDAALLDVLTGTAVAKGHLPFELPATMAAVEAQDPAKPDDSQAPLYPAGYP